MNGIHSGMEDATFMLHADFVVLTNYNSAHIDAIPTRTRIRRIAGHSRYIRMQ